MKPTKDIAMKIVKESRMRSDSQGYCIELIATALAAERSKVEGLVEALEKMEQKETPEAIDWKWWDKEFGGSPMAMCQMLAWYTRDARVTLKKFRGEK